MNIMLPGTEMRVLVGAEETGGAFTLMECVKQPEAVVPPLHTHTAQDELTYVLEGTLSVQLGERVTQVGAGECIVRPRGVPHTMANTGSAAVRFLEISTPVGIERYFGELAALMPAGASGPPSGAEMAALMPKVATIAAKHGIRFGAVGPAR